MKMRSTGLGKTELTGGIEDIRVMGDFLVLVIQTSQPVKWKVRAALDHRDLFSLLRLMFKLSNLKYILLGLFRRKKNPDIPAF